MPVAIMLLLLVDSINNLLNSKDQRRELTIMLKFLLTKLLVHAEIFDNIFNDSKNKKDSLRLKKPGNFHLKAETLLSSKKELMRKANSRSSGYLRSSFFEQTSF